MKVRVSAGAMLDCLVVSVPMTARTGPSFASERDEKRNAIIVALIANYLARAGA